MLAKQNGGVDSWDVATEAGLPEKCLDTIISEAFHAWLAPFEPSPKVWTRIQRRILQQEDP